MAEKGKDRLQIPLMFAFRDAYASKDATSRDENWVGGERIVADRNILRRSATEAVLKRDLSTDLASLVDTINLASCVDLTELPYVAGSVLNYGLPDLSAVTVGADDMDVVGTSLRTALLNHEPRLNARSVAVTRNGNEDDERQRVRFQVAAEMLARPLDIPVEFVAEVDVGAGKVLVSRLPGAS